MNDIYDIIIIGGGPAGSTAALMLNDFNIAVIEKKEFPREVLCGEFLSLEVMALLRKLNLIDEFFSLYPNSIDQLSIYNGNSQLVNVPLGFTSYALKRSLFDTLLLNTAQRRGADVYQPAEVLNIKKENELFIVKIKAAKEEEELRAKLVIAAYGKQNYLDKELNRSFIGKTTHYFGVKYHVPLTHLNTYDPNEIAIYLGDNIYCGINVVNHSEATVCYLTKSKFERDSITLLLDIDINKLKPYGTSSIYFGERDKVVNGIFMIGDAAGMIAPLAGDGIGMAMQSAELLSELIKTTPNQNELAVRYTTEWNRLFLTRISNAMFIQQLLLKKQINSRAILFAKMFPSLINYFIKSTRK